MRHRPGKNIKLHEMKNEKKKLRGFSFSKCMANFEVFHWNFLSSETTEIVRGDNV